MSKFVCVDLGASSTRFSCNGKPEVVISNNIAFLEPDEKVDVEVPSDNIYNALELHIVKDGVTKREENENGIEYFPADILIGDLAERYSYTIEKPQGWVSKYKQRVNYMSAIASVALSLVNDNDLDKQDVELYIALPPVEVPMAKEYMKEKLVGKYNIKMPKIDKEINFTVTNVNCLEESSLALLSFLFDTNGKIKEGANKYIKLNMLSIDIGASTSDLAICKNGVYINKTGKTYKTGGNVAKQYLANYIASEYSIDITDDMEKLAMSEGRIRVGSKFKDISSVVVKAKQELAKQIAVQIPDYFRSVNIPIQDIGAIVVSGGGSMESFYIENGEKVVTSPSTSKFITDNIKAICDTSDVVQYPVEEARFANLKGLIIKAKLDAAIRASKSKVK